MAWQCVSILKNYKQVSSNTTVGVCVARGRKSRQNEQRVGWFRGGGCAPKKRDVAVGFRLDTWLVGEAADACALSDGGKRAFSIL